MEKLQVVGYGDVNRYHALSRPRSCPTIGTASVALTACSVCSPLYSIRYINARIISGQCDLNIKASAMPLNL